MSDDVSGNEPDTGTDAGDAPDPYRVNVDGLADDFGEWQAVNWTVERIDGDDRKIPKRPDSPTENAKSNDASTWGAFETAIANARENDDLGLGFPCAQPGHPFVHIDVDIPGSDEWVPPFDRLGGANIERSPSGTSRRIILRDCEVPEWWTNQAEETDDGTREVKVFSNTGYVTLTGDVLDGHGPPLEATHSPALDQWLRKAWLTFNDPDDDEPKPWEDADGRDAVNSPDDGESDASDAGDGDEWLTADVASDALGQIDPDIHHDEWVGVGFALVNHFGRSTGGSLFKEWSRSGRKWDEQAADRVVEDAGGYPHGIGHFVNVAKRHGWDASAAARAAVASTDGGTTAARSAPTGTASTGPDTPTTLPADPSGVHAYAGLGDDDDIHDLDDRERAACVWGLIKQSDEYHIRIRRDNSAIWSYDGDRGIWTADGERTLRYAARQALGPMNYGQNVLTELKEQARSDPLAEIEADALGLDPGQIAVANGLVNLEQGTIRDLRPDDLALTRLPVEYDPDAEYDEWATYVEDWAEDGRADALQEYVGYCLHIGAMPIHRAMLLVGSGANGKGTFLSVVRSLLGEQNTTSIELQTLANERDAVADFYGSVANIDDDLSARSLGRGLGMFKKLTAGDRVRGRHLYEGAFEFYATGKHLYAANEVPDVSGDVPEDDEAFWRRWTLVEFPNHYPPSERDPTLRDQLTEPETLSGVLNWAIEGRRRLLNQGYFTNEKRFAQAKRERWQAWGDSVDKFISEHVENDPDAPRISTGDAHRRYAAWCRANGEKPVGQQQLTNTLKNEDVGYSTSLRINGENPQYGYKALGLSDAVPALDSTPDREDDPRPDEDLSSYEDPADDREADGIDTSEIVVNSARKPIQDAIAKHETAEQGAPVGTVLGAIAHTPEAAREHIEAMIEDGIITRDDGRLRTK